jgi:hypothetical protein
MARKKDELRIGGPKEEKHLAAIAFAVFTILSAGIIAWSWLSGIEWSEGYAACYEQACDDARLSVAMQLDGMKPFEMGKTRVALVPLGDRTFFVHVKDPAKFAPAAATIDTGEGVPGQ